MRTRDSLIPAASHDDMPLLDGPSKQTTSNGGYSSEQRGVLHDSRNTTILQSKPAKNLFQAQGRGQYDQFERMHHHEQSVENVHEHHLIRKFAI